MPRIVPAIASLEQHFKALHESPQTYRPACCPGCGLGGLWAHGEYWRKADRDTGELNPIAIPRFVCGRKRGCGQTCSVLPGCLSPRRWYDWAAQEAVLALLLAGTSVRACAQRLGRARSTVRRWWRGLQERHEGFAFHLRSHWSDLGRASSWRELWQGCLAQRPLREVMAWLDRQGIPVP